ncbi:MAG: glycosyltransferase family 1 protein [Rhodocyclaceae bacterium]
MKLIFGADAIRPPLTGIGRYAWELVRQLPLVGGLDDIRYLYGFQVMDAPPALPTGSGSAPPRKLRRLLLRSPWVTATYQRLAALRQARALNRHRGALYHGPNFYLPACDLPRVATFHDLSVYKKAECHPPERVRFMQTELPVALERASFLITDSEFTRREIIDYFSWPADRIRAVPLAASPDFHPRPAAATTAVLAGYGLVHGQYCLYAGSIEPRKNIEVLLSAYEHLPEDVRQRWPLILAGYEGWKSESIHARLRTAQAAGWARYLGFVADADLPVLYAGARLFAFPSLYEGFGLPVLEAMASGVPVVCSDATSLPEVAGGAAAMCAPLDVDGLRAALGRGLEDDAWREQAMLAGVTRAAQFSWARTAAETAAVYRLVLK